MTINFIELMEISISNKKSIFFHVKWFSRMFWDTRSPPMWRAQNTMCVKAIFVHFPHKINTYTQMNIRIAKNSAQSFFFRLRHCLIKRFSQKKNTFFVSILRQHTNDYVFASHCLSLSLFFHYTLRCKLYSYCFFFFFIQCGLHLCVKKWMTKTIVWIKVITVELNET